MHKNKQSVTIMWQYTMHVYPHSMLIWLGWKGRGWKRGEGKLGKNTSFLLFGWWKKMKGKEYRMGDFPREIQISIPHIGERKEDKKCEECNYYFAI